MTRIEFPVQISGRLEERRGPVWYAVFGTVFYLQSNIYLYLFNVVEGVLYFFVVHLCRFGTEVVDSIDHIL